MKTIMKNYAKSLDEMIPDLTLDIAVDKMTKIEKGTKDTLLCYGATLLCAGATISNISELTVIASKTLVKAAGKKIMSEYKNSDPVAIRR